MTQASFEPGTSRSRVLSSAVAPHWLGVALVLCALAVVNQQQGGNKWRLVGSLAGRARYVKRRLSLTEPVF